MTVREGGESMMRGNVGLTQRMRRIWASRVAVLVAAGVVGLGGIPTFGIRASRAGTVTPSGAEGTVPAIQEIDISKRRLVPTGRNRYFILEPGFQAVLEGKTEKLMITVLDQTKTVAGVVTRVVEEKEWKKGVLVEVSRNFFAMDEHSSDVFYFGEEVDMYTGGKVTSHAGAWLAGENGAKPGLIMPGQPKLGMRYYQEIAPGVALDRAEVVSLDYTLETPAGRFTECLRTEEGTPLDPREREFKTYAPGVGLIQDADLLLTKYGSVR